MIITDFINKMNAGHNYNHLKTTVNITIIYTHFSIDKCLLPYYGGCSYTRICVTSEFDVNCRNCFPGFFQIGTNQICFGNSLIFLILHEYLFLKLHIHLCLFLLVGIRLEQSTYSVREDAGNVEVCAILMPIDGDQILSVTGLGITTVQLNIANIFQSAYNSAAVTIPATLSTVPLTSANAATGILL